MRATRLLKYLVRTLVSATLMIWLFSKIEVAEIISSWQDVNWIQLMVLILLIHSICLILRAVRLSRILRTLDLDPPLWWLILNQLKGSFFRSFSPGEIAGDIYRTYSLAQTTAHTSKSFSAIALEKSFGLVSMVLLSVFGLFYGMYGLGHPVFRQIALPILSCAGIIMVAIAIAGVLARRWLRHSNPKLSSFYAVSRKIFGQIACCVSNRHALVQLTLVSLLLQIAVVSWYFAISKSLQFHLPFFVLMATIPVVELLLLVPVSIGGIGVRDTAFVILLAPFGLTVEQVLSFSMLSFSVATLVTAFSGLAFFFNFKIKNELPLQKRLVHRRLDP